MATVNSKPPALVTRAVRTVVQPGSVNAPDSTLIARPQQGRLWLESRLAEKLDATGVAQ
jgi:hypothetical protein